MFAVIFEVQPKPDRWEEYLALAKFLKPELERIDGFMDSERFASRRTEGRVLSLSIWRDEKALVRWRTLAVHHEVQQRGRSTVFADYHLRVGEITGDTQIPAGHDLPQQRFDTTEVGNAKAVTIVEVLPAAVTAGAQPAFGRSAFDNAPGLVDLETFESIYAPGKLLWLAAWHYDAALQAWQQRNPLATPADGVGAVRVRSVRIIRDYGMFERREAPQCFPPVDKRTSVQPEG